jgi:pimeloyl-ACP methyl ester carboxylesterase
VRLCLVALVHGAASCSVQLPGRALRMEYAVARALAPSADKPAVPLVFVHGTFHGSWCFAEHWLPYFSRLGYDAYAVSLRGTSASPEPSPRRIRVDEHVDDLAAFLAETVRRPCVLIGHSFGGAYVQKMLQRGETSLLGAVLLCSVPPTGNSAMIWRFLRRSPIGALRITRGLALKSACRSVDDASALFFSGDLPEEDVRRYMVRFGADSSCGLDLADFNAKLPASGDTSWIRERCPPMLVLGAERDAVVDVEAIKETASFYGATSVVLPELGHDVMLVPRWALAADEIHAFLQSTVTAR